MIDSIQIKQKCAHLILTHQTSLLHDVSITHIFISMSKLLRILVTITV